VVDGEGGGSGGGIWPEPPSASDEPLPRRATTSVGKESRSIIRCWLLQMMANGGAYVFHQSVNSNEPQQNHLTRPFRPSLQKHHSSAHAIELHIHDDSRAPVQLQLY